MQNSTVARVSCGEFQCSLSALWIKNSRAANPGQSESCLKFKPLVDDFHLEIFFKKDLLFKYLFI